MHVSEDEFGRENESTMTGGEGGGEEPAVGCSWLSRRRGRTSQKSSGEIAGLQAI
jgi:hypothetical protein